MVMTKLAAASAALLLSGWSLYEAGRSSRALHQSQIRHRSAEDELRRMQAQPEEALVLWVPGELDPPPSDAPAVERGSARSARSKRASRASAGSSGQERLSSVAAQE
jgi:hypothetical protein